MSRLITRNPADGQELESIAMTPADALSGVFTRAQDAQTRWATLSVRRRAEHLLDIREVLLNRADEVVDLIMRETGKPRFEALSSEVLPVVEHLTYFARRAPRILDDRPIALRLMKHRLSELNYWPLGTVLVISPWNFPFLLPFADILMALVAGNAVIFKPSEVTPLVGRKIQELCDEAGLPTQLLQTVFGEAELGAALVEQKPAKVFFTGSVGTGKKVMAAAARTLTPVNLELGGKDALIVLPDADLDYATSAALWGGFANAGQACASVERILVHEQIADGFTELLRKKLATLRVGKSSTNQNDVGPVTLEKQKTVYDRHLSQARSSGASIVAGGEFTADRRYLLPTVVTGGGVESLEIYNEETFGPVVAVTRFQSVNEAVEKANRSAYGLAASVITRDLALGRKIARRLEVGTVMINEVLYTAGLPETPWGGVKDSGFGRTHSEIGLLEFVNVRHIHRPRFRFLSFKSPWWYPYGDFQYATFRRLLELYRRSWLDRLRALPLFILSAVEFLKREKRL